MQTIISPHLVSQQYVQVCPVSIDVVAANRQRELPDAQGLPEPLETVAHLVLHVLQGLLPGELLALFELGGGDAAGWDFQLPQLGPSQPGNGDQAVCSHFIAFKRFIVINTKKIQHAALT